MIKLIINADDFGYSRVFNEKILDLLEKGFLKSTTVMVDWAKAGQQDQVNRLIRLNQTGGVGVGLHVVLDSHQSDVEWEQQMIRQFGEFRRLFHFNPDHLDWHKHIGKAGVNAIIRFAKPLGIPVRYLEMVPETKHTTRPVLNTLPLDLKKATAFLDSLKDGESAEILCHPGDFDPESKSTLNAERKRDYENVVRLQDYLKQKPAIQIVNYKQL